MDQTTENKTNEIDHSLLPEDSITIIIKAGGKVYSAGANLGKIFPGMPDEDLDSTLRAVRGLGINVVRTLAYTVAARPDSYEIPLTDVEQDDGSSIRIMLADEDIAAGDAVVVDESTARARKATEADGITRAEK